ncbi:MAG: T9SS type B sorting domain-containing protein, partial [Ferruginibacter sp.]
IRYADKEVVMNFELPLAARQIGNSVLWTPATSLNNPGIYNPVFKGLDPQLYNIRLKTLAGCVTVDTQYVKTRKKIEIYVPTSFTPNGDGLNDYLRPFTLSFKSVTYFRVYNRWGKLLYQMQSDVPGWDGRTNGQVQEMQTVVWEIEAVDVDGNVHKKKGTSILLH